MSMTAQIKQLLKRPSSANHVSLLNVRLLSTQVKKRKSKYLSTNDAPPHRIGVIKSWDSKHTGSLQGSPWAHDLFMDDVMIRKFIEGTFYEMLMSDVIIKRRLNQIIISIFVNAKGTTVHKIYFLVGFSEKLLQQLLGCLVKMEIMTVPE